MTVLKTVSGTIISNRVRSFLTSKDIIKTRNQLLDGSYHIQTLGDAYKVADVTCNLTYSQKEVLENAYIADEPLRLEADGKYHIGLLQENPQVDSFIANKRMKKYVMSLSMIISEEGIL